jgi:hypothetical protein
MSTRRLVGWTLVWIAGWALFFLHPVGYSGLGAVLLLCVAPLFMVTPAEWRRNGSVRLSMLVLVLLVCVFLLLVFVLPPSYTWEFPDDLVLGTGVKAFGLIVAAFGIGINSRRFARDEGAA